MVHSTLNAMTFNVTACKEILSPQTPVTCISTFLVQDRNPGLEFRKAGHIHSLHALGHENESWKM